MRFQSCNTIGDPITTEMSQVPHWKWSKSTKSDIVTVQPALYLYLNTSQVSIIHDWAVRTNNPVVFRPGILVRGFFFLFCRFCKIRVKCKEDKHEIHQFLFENKELCYDKFCQMADLSGQDTVLAFSVINFSPVSRFLSPLTKLL